MDLDTSVFGKLSTPRYASEDIYVLGGWSNGQKISTVTCFNVDTLQWSPVSNMTVAHVAGMTIDSPRTHFKKLENYITSY